MEGRDTRSLVLDAAENVVSREGAASLTLDAVAREADISKGGLLYHFPSKAALIEALIVHNAQRFETCIERELAIEPDAPGRWTRAYIRATMQSVRHPNFSAGLITSIAAEPALLSHIQGKIDNWREKLRNDRLDPAVASIVQLTLDGWKLWRTFQLVPENEGLPDGVLEYLMELTKRESA